MIRITSKTGDYICRFEGSLNKIPHKRNRVITNSTSGVLDETFTRGLSEYDLVISEMDRTEYDIFCRMFIYENEFIIEDLSRGIEDAYFLIDLDEIVLPYVEDKSTFTEFYTGNLRLRRI